MTFSSLQQHIIKICYGRDKVDRKIFANFYGGKNIKEIARTKIITKSLERLIDKGLMVGYGVRTPKKWFIKEVRITKQGKKIWEKWLNRKQRKLAV